MKRGWMAQKVLQAICAMVASAAFASDFGKSPPPVTFHPGHTKAGEPTHPTPPF